MRLNLNELLHKFKYHILADARLVATHQLTVRDH